MSYASIILGLGSVALALLIPPLAWHLKTRNTPAIILIIWLFLMDVKLLVDAGVWSGNEYAEKWNGAVWCDIMTKLQIGANVGISCSVANIAYNLHAILKADAVIPDHKSRRKILTDLAITLASPIVTMGLSYLVQVVRFGVARYSGCQNILSNSWLTIVIYTLWMLVWSLLGFIYALLLLYVFYRKRKDVRDILHCTNSGLNLARFSRLLLFCILIIMVMFPFSLYSFIIDIAQGLDLYNYNDVHEKITYIVFFDPGKPLYSVWLYILMSYLVFIVFGTGSDAIAMYVKILRTIGLGPCIDEISDVVSSRKARDSSQAVTTFLAETKAYYSDGTLTDSTQKSFMKGSISYDAPSTSGSGVTNCDSKFIIDYMLPHERERCGQSGRQRLYNDVSRHLALANVPANPIDFHDENSICELSGSSSNFRESISGRSPTEVNNILKDEVLTQGRTLDDIADSV
ncbi:LAMI_0G08284g1_1 [Lachancea mirantina]|uniref:LAMI_0G08284g1_1 n=1 Tax=Lachancea mirantina TaxID=1230905 RepID=A0A1G4KA17_9SACH|nr:LAMI_0G08284g1_1 [Lachancea mirantina]